MTDKRRLSKFLSHVLRHNPQKFDIKLDSQGFAKLDKIVELLSVRFPGVNRKAIIELVEASPKKRFEIIGSKIRASYGHSIAVDLNLPQVKPPEVLYHGTSKKSAEKILKSGLKRMGRQFVHLCRERQEAYQVGLRKDSKPVVLRIRSRQAYDKGINFYKSGNLYLSSYIPARFILPT